MSNKNTNLKPLFDNVLIKPIQQDTKLPSGIIIPDTASKEKPQKGEVIAVGSGKKDETGKAAPLSVKAKDIVMFKKWGGTEVKIDNEEYLLIKEEDILAIYE